MECLCVPSEGITCWDCQEGLAQLEEKLAEYVEERERQVAIIKNLMATPPGPLYTIPRRYWD